MRCNHCNGEHPDDFKFCPVTGKEIEQPMKACSNPDCDNFEKHFLPYEAKYCPKCGKELDFSPIFNIVREFNDLNYWAYSEDVILFSNECTYKYGFMNISGEVIIPDIYDDAGKFADGLAPVSKDQKWGFVNHRGDIIIPLTYDYAGSFSEGLACVWRGDYCGWINCTGHLVIPMIYQCTAYCRNGIINTELNGRSVLIDATGKFILEHSDDYKSINSDECCGYLIHVTDKNTGLVGLIDKNGSVVVPCKYEDLSQFDYGGYAQIRNNGLWGLIDTTGNEIFPCEFKHWVLHHNGSFYTNEGGRAVVYKSHYNKVSGCNEICEIHSSSNFEFYHQWLNNNYMVVTSSGLYGIIDEKLQIILPIEYDNIRVIENTNMIIANKSGNIKLMNIQ